MTERLRVRISGAVQGVGFRPFVHGLAARYGLSGFVLNDQEGVLAEIEGRDGAMFLTALRRERPVLARIDAIAVTRVPALGRSGFAIHDSVMAGDGRSVGVPDAAPCRSCLKDLFDPGSRFHLYPFVTCTDCGPRFTITSCSPYDRAHTAMAGFPLCSLCEADYRDPRSRRFHAEAIACPACGPRLSHTMEEITSALRDGRVVALKGIGGFHLLCDATDEDTVRTLRARKRRPARPFAVMVGSEVGLRQFARTTITERAMLRTSARPIVLVGKGSGLAVSVAPCLDRVGVMLPSSPVHHLLFAALSARAALIVTSANVAGAPLVIDNAVALRDLISIADVIVTHDRPILERIDDSVMTMIDGAPAFLRRGRGFVPEPVDLGEDGAAVVAVGAHLKATVCVTRGREAFVSQHLGDLDSAETARFHASTLARLVSALGVKPVLAVCDLHPDYRSTVVAEGLSLPVLRVQHHAAHLAAVAAEHGLRGRLLGVALDGHGYGLDGNAWGGELLESDDVTWRRVGHLGALAMPGGDRAAREPWRMGLAVMMAVGRSDEGRFAHHPPARSLMAMMSAGAGIPVTTSMGRHFDAVAALLGVCEVQSHEGQAAMELEALVEVPRVMAGGFEIRDHVLDLRPLLGAMLGSGLRAAEGASLFHGTVIAGLSEWIGRRADETGRIDIVLGGGCFTNRILADGVTGALRARGLRPWLARAVPANDAGISLGQAAMARAHLAAGHKATA